MPFDLQTRLLRVLSDGHYYRVGGHDPIRANVRIIAATHQNLEARVAQGLFREDLLHRLNGVGVFDHRHRKGKMIDFSGTLPLRPQSDVQRARMRQEQGLKRGVSEEIGKEN